MAVKQCLPIKCVNNKTHLTIYWNNGQISNISGKILRENCPCAICKEERTAPKKTLNIINSSAQQMSTINKIWQVGNYALGVAFEDGHNDGIFRWTQLKDIS